MEPEVKLSYFQHLTHNDLDKLSNFLFLSFLICKRVIETTSGLLWRLNEIIYVKFLAGNWNIVSTNKCEFLL